MDYASVRCGDVQSSSRRPRMDSALLDFLLEEAILEYKAASGAVAAVAVEAAHIENLILLVVLALRMDVGMMLEDESYYYHTLPLERNTAKVRLDDLGAIKLAVHQHRIGHQEMS
jgi:hypothetical protein